MTVPGAVDGAPTTLLDHTPARLVPRGALRPYGVRAHLAVSFAAPMTLGRAATSDPLDDTVRSWWRAAAGGGFAAVSNVGDYGFWTGRPLAQANLDAFGRTIN